MISAPAAPSTLVDSVNVVDFDRDVGVDVCLDVELHHAQLHFPLIRPEEQDPVEALAAVKTDHVVVERPALVETFRQDVRLDPSDPHRRESLDVRVTFPNAGQRKQPATRASTRRDPHA